MADARSGQITVTTAGTAVAGPSTPRGSWFMLTADPGNTGEVFFGNDGNDDVTVNNGFALNDSVKVKVSRNLSSLYFDAETNGDKVCWLAIE